jgi:serine/threonine protein kinase
MQAQMQTMGEPLDAGSLLAGRYRIFTRVGEGGFGVVYKARDTKAMGRLVAIKQIDLGALSPRQIIEATDSYNREVSILSRLEHRSLPRIYNHFTDPTHWYLVMQYIEGETLDDYLKKKGRLSVQEVSAIGIQLSKVLAFLHRCRPPIIFRDVKPANIMRTRRGRLYLIDFGIARRFSPDKKRDTGPLGSPGYAAPEQYGRAQSTEQTDIYGLGATLQTLLTGREPYDDEQAALPMPTDKRTQRLQQLLDAMQAHNAADRPRTARDVREQLRSARSRYPRLRAFLLQIYPFLIGLFIGSLPYCFVPLLHLNILSFPGLALIAVPVFLLFFLWPLVAVTQCVAILLLFLSNRRRMALGILIMFILIYAAVILGWLPMPGLFISV